MIWRQVQAYFRAGLDRDRHGGADQNFRALINDICLRLLTRAIYLTRVVDRGRRRAEPHIGKLLELFPVHAVLQYPVSEQAMQTALQPPA